MQRAKRSEIRRHRSSEWLGGDGLREDSLVGNIRMADNHGRGGWEMVWHNKN